jgi:Ca2+-binding RTX toxin-like protein
MRTYGARIIAVFHKEHEMAIINGDSAANTLVGTQTADTLNGLGGNDTLYGQNGNDMINGGVGNDVLWGMGGNDTYQFASGDGVDTLYTYEGNFGFSGADVLQFSNVASTQVTFRRIDSSTVQANYMGGQISIQGGVGIRRIQFSDAVSLAVSRNAEVDDSVSAVGQIGIDGLLGGSRYVSGDGQPLVLTYGFPDYSGNNETDDGTVLLTASAAYRQAVSQQLQALSKLINVQFVEVTNTSAARLADINFAGMVLPESSNLAGYAYYPGASTVVLRDDAASDFSAGGEFYQVLLHELGHKMGLKHTFESSSAFGALPTALDMVQQTVMTYNWSGVNARSYSILDVQALQYLYGANTSTASGNDSYTIDLTAQHHETLWDGGGTDTINLVGNGATFSLMQGAINADSRGDGVIAIAYGMTLENLNGTSGNDTLTGNAAANVIDGRVGADRMIGGLGNDTYHVDNTADVIVEDSAAGTDIVNSSVAYTLASNLEKLTLTGAAAINGAGNALSNTLTGNAATNYLYGQSGNDSIYAGGGNDVLYGGYGNDLLWGNAGNDRVDGGAGNDTLYGNAGTDTLTGGLGNDTYWLRRNEGTDTIIENDSTAGNLDVVAFGTDILANQLWFKQSGQDLLISVIGTTDQMSIKDWFVGVANHVESIISGDHLVLTDSRVQTLVNAMAGLTPPAIGQTSLSASQHSQLDSILNAQWLSA